MINHRVFTGKIFFFFCSKRELLIISVRSYSHVYEHVLGYLIFHSKSNHLKYPIYFYFWFSSHEKRSIINRILFLFFCVYWMKFLLSDYIIQWNFSWIQSTEIKYFPFRGLDVKEKEIRIAFHFHLPAPLIHRKCNMIEEYLARETTHQIFVFVFPLFPIFPDREKKLFQLNIVLSLELVVLVYYLSCNFHLIREQVYDD